MSYDTFTLLITGLNLLGGPALALVFAARLRRRDASRTDWSGYLLAFCVLGGIMFLSPARWHRIAPETLTGFENPLAGAELSFGIWIAALLTVAISVPLGVVGLARASRRRSA